MRLALRTALFALLPLARLLAALFTHDVDCHGTKCGTMDIDTYKVGLSISPSHSADWWLGGVEIKGEFKAERAAEYHYIQSINGAPLNAPFHYIDRTPLPLPWIDPPPGGYMVKLPNGEFTRQDFDQKPYYDERAFPRFYDFPRDYLMRAVTAPGNIYSYLFETWLICEILESLGAEPGFARDDRYKVAPLLGWTWGYRTAYSDNANGVLDIGDFTVTALPFIWKVGAPSDDWKKALGQRYGMGRNRDGFRVELGDCLECFPTPEPGTYATVLLGMVLLVRKKLYPERRESDRALS